MYEMVSDNAAETPIDSLSIDLCITWSIMHYLINNTTKKIE